MDKGFLDEGCSDVRTFGFSDKGLSDEGFWDKGCLNAKRHGEVSSS